MTPGLRIEQGLKGVRDSLYTQYPKPVDGVNTFFNFPNPTNLNYCCTPQTALMGTAPYVLGRGAVSNNVDIESVLRPQSTIRADRSVTEKFWETPFQYIEECLLPPETLPSTRGGVSSRANYRNMLYTEGM